jgi:predicted adenylyl cyclase CyaB
MQKEIEIKFKPTSEQFELLKNWLKQNAKFLCEKVITDYYLDNPKSSFHFMSPKGYKEVLQFLRIRIEDKKNELCFKKRNVDKEGNTVDVDEYEVTVDNGQKLLHILELSGFTNNIKVKKTRYTYSYQDFEILIDDVEYLGLNCEVELQGHDDDVKVGIEKIYNLLRSIGIKEVTTFDRGYVCMQINPEYDFSKKIKL